MRAKRTNADKEKSKFCKKTDAPSPPNKIHSIKALKYAFIVRKGGQVKKKDNKGTNHFLKFMASLLKNENL